MDVAVKLVRVNAKIGDKEDFLGEAEMMLSLTSPSLLKVGILRLLSNHAFIKRIAWVMVFFVCCSYIATFNDRLMLTLRYGSVYVRSSNKTMELLWLL